MSELKGISHDTYASIAAMIAGMVKNGFKDPVLAYISGTITVPAINDSESTDAAKPAVTGLISFDSVNALDRKPLWVTNDPIKKNIAIAPAHTPLGDRKDHRKFIRPEPHIRDYFCRKAGQLKHIDIQNHLREENDHEYYPSIGVFSLSADETKT